MGHLLNVLQWTRKAGNRPYAKTYYKDLLQVCQFHPRCCGCFGEVAAHPINLYDGGDPFGSVLDLLYHDFFSGSIGHCGHGYFHSARVV